MSLPLVSLLFLLIGFARAGFIYQKGYSPRGQNYLLGTFGGHLPDAVKVIRVTNTVAVPVPVPFPVTKNIPYPVEVPKPIPYAVPHPLPVEVTKPFVIPHQIPLEIPKPYPVPQPSYPSHALVAPPFNQQPDYRSYLSYSQGSIPSGYGGYGPPTAQEESQYKGNDVTFGHKFETNNHLEEQPSSTNSPAY